LSELTIEAELIFEPLGPSHDRAAFSCGVPKLDTYLKTQASQDVKKNLGAVFVLTPDHKQIDGYYSLSHYSVRLDTIPEEVAAKLTKHPDIPATLIGRLARSLHLKGTRTGEMLLMDALKRILSTSRQVASWAVIVDAKDDNAIKFYQKYGFMTIPTAPNRLFIPIETVAKMF
jgi:predicted GNAT family N-acyltransferase